MEYKITTKKDYSDYYQGASAYSTPYADVCIGCGTNEREALDDALEQMAERGIDTTAIEPDLDKCSTEETENEDQYYYVEVYYTTTEEPTQ